MRRQVMTGLAAAAAMMLLCSVPVFAAGWTKEGTRWKWYNVKGEAATNTWKTWEDGKERWLDDTGFMVTDSWVKQNGNYYFVDDDGVRLTNTWAELNPPDQVKGTADQGVFNYYFGNTGKMADDRFISKDGEQVYVGADGKMQYGWLKDNVYFADENGILVTGWQELEGPDSKTHQYYFGTNGKKTRAGDGYMYRTREIGETEYCFDENGILQTGWVDIAVTKDGNAEEHDWRYYDEDGAAASGRVIFAAKDGSQTSYYFRKNGSGITGVYDSKLYYEGILQQATAKTGYRVVSVPEKEQGKYVNYLVDTKGNVVKKEKVRSKNGVRYETDAGGRVRTVNGASAEGKKYSLPTVPDRNET
ncbi:MAG: hypothetical protein IJT43_03410 [Stomatobaculum sp.]|nr:hypothetical protein [Stomatobaculum sp.]